MKNKVKNAINGFIDEPQDQNEFNEKSKKVILNQREGLIERVDKIFVDKSGRQLLREQY